MQELIKNETSRLINFSYPFHLNNAAKVKYAARMVGRHYDVIEEEKKDEEVVVKTEKDAADDEVKTESDEKDSSDVTEKEEAKEEVKEEAKEEESKTEVKTEVKTEPTDADVKKSPVKKSAIVKGLFNDDVIISVMNDIITNDEAFRNAQVSFSSFHIYLQRTIISVLYLHFLTCI